MVGRCLPAKVLTVPDCDHVDVDIPSWDGVTGAGSEGLSARML